MAEKLHCDRCKLEIAEEEENYLIIITKDKKMFRAELGTPCLKKLLIDGVGFLPNIFDEEKQCKGIKSQSCVPTQDVPNSVQN